MNYPSPCRETPAEAAVYRKISRRLLPFLFVLYLVAYIDRVNVGFAKLQMSADLGFSDWVYGSGAGVFFVGYFLFEVPSNLLLHRLGARRWIARILVVWGIISTAMMAVDSALSFYLLRFLLGLGEAGFFPGVILYLTYWFPAQRRAKSTALFMTAVAVAGVVGGPLSGWIMAELDGEMGWRGWQWLFLLEGLPAVLLGLVTWFYLDNGPADAAWLSAADKALVLRRLAEDHARPAAARDHTAAALWQVLRSPPVWRLSAVYFCFALGLYGVSFWLPQIVNDLRQGGLLMTGLLSAIPYAVAMLTMVAVAQYSDRRRQRRQPMVASMGVAVLGLLALTATTAAPGGAIAALSMVAAGILSAAAVFWALPTALLSGRAAAAGIALINAIGNLGGYFGPVILASAREMTGNLNAGLLVLAAAMLLAAVLVWSMPTADGTAPPR